MLVFSCLVVIFRAQLRRESIKACVVGGFFFGHVDERGGFRSGLRPGLKRSRCYGFIIIIFFTYTQN